MIGLLDTEDESDLRAAVRRLLADRVDASATIRIYDGEREAVPGLWRSVAAELGLAGLMVPTGLGGGGGSARDAAVVLEELGRAVAPVPFLTSSVIATSLLLDPDTCAPGTELLEQMAGGRRTVALLSPFSAATAAAATSIDLDGEGRMTGEVRSVAGVLDAEDLLVPARTSDGVTILRVATHEVESRPVVSLDMTRQLADVRLQGVRGETLVAAGHGAAALDRALTTGAALLASEQVGVAAWCLRTTVDYSRTRRQFGRQVGSFQALKHRLADLFVAVDAPDAPLATAVAAAWCSDVAVRAAEEAVQLHGGIGMTWEHPAHLYLKRAKADQIALGTPGLHRARLAELVELPASV